MSIPINNVTRRVVYAASGTGPYNFSFEILAATDIAVYRDDTLLTLTTDYTVTINANGTGSVTLVADPAPATQIAIVGNRTIQRLSDFVTGGDFFANVLNNELDQQTIFAQQNAEGLGRALVAPQTDPISINMTMPGRTTRANQLLRFDANGDPSVTAFGSTGTGSLVLQTSPTLITPNIGTPSAGVLTNCTGLPVASVTGLAANVSAFLAGPSSANLAAAVTDETGTGALVFATSPVLVTPNLGTPSAITLTNATGLPISTGVSGLGTNVATALAVNVGSAGALVVNGGALGTPSSGTLTNATGLPIDGGTTGTLPANRGGTGLTALGTGVATFLGTPSSANLAAAVTGETGSGALVFATSPTLVTPALGTPSSGTLSSCTGLPIDGGTTGTLPAGRGGTGLTALGTGVANFLATPSSANLAAAVTGETGTGALVFATSPTLVTPTIGVATATSINSLVLNRGTGTGNAESVAVGGTALDSATNGEKNTAVGYAAGTQVTSGKESIFIGWTAGKDYTTGEQSIYIGAESQASSGSATQEIVLGRGLTGKGSNTFYVGGADGAYNEDNNASWLTTSDQRIKKNIVDSSDGLAKIQAVRVRNFEYRAHNEITDLPQSEAIKKLGVQIGVIAQEMLPECVRERSNGVLSVDTDRLIWYLVNAVKQLAARIEELEGNR